MTRQTMTVYGMISAAYERLMATPKKDWDLYMKSQQLDLQRQYAAYMEVGKLLKQIAARPTVQVSYRLVTPRWDYKTAVAAAHARYTADCKLAGKGLIPQPPPFVMPAMPEPYYETVVETDNRKSENGLERLRAMWMFNPTHTAEQIVQALADFPVYAVNDKLYQTALIKRIRRQALRFLHDPKPQTAEQTAIMQAAPSLPQFVTIPQNLRLLEVEADIYQRHLTSIYVTGPDGRTTGMDLPLDNQFARLRASNRKHYDAGKYNPRYEAQLTEDRPETTHTRRAVRFLARKVAEGCQVKIVADRTAAHGMILVRAIASMTPQAQAEISARPSAPGPSSNRVIDERDFDDTPLRPLRKRSTYISARRYRRIRDNILGEEHGPIPLPKVAIDKMDALEIKWWNLYWMPRKYICYLVCSVRSFVDRNGLKKHVVIYLPATLVRPVQDPETGEMRTKTVRRSRSAWAIVEDEDLRKLSRRDKPVAKLDREGNVTGYTTWRPEPAGFRGRLPERFTTLIPPEEAGRYDKHDLRPLYKNYWRKEGLLGYFLKAKPIHYNSPVRNTFAHVLANVAQNRAYRRAMEQIDAWEHEQLDRKEYDESETNHGRFDAHAQMLDATKDEAVMAALESEGATDGLDLLADGEMDLATAAELAVEGMQLKRRPKLQQVEDTLDKLYRELAEADQAKADLRIAETKTQILATLKRHPELEAELSRLHNPNGRICKIWQSKADGDGWVHTPLSQMFRLTPITVRKSGRVLTPEEQAALPENEGRRYIAGEWDARTQPAPLPATPNPWAALKVRNHKRIYELRRTRLGKITQVKVHPRTPALITRLYSPAAPNCKAA